MPVQVFFCYPGSYVSIRSYLVAWTDGNRAGSGVYVRRVYAGAIAAIAELLPVTKDFKEEVS